MLESECIIWDSFISISSLDKTACNFELSGNWIKVKAMFTVYRIDFAPPRKSYRIGLLFTHKNWQREAVPRRSLKWTWVTCWIHVGVHTIYRIASQSWYNEKLSGIVWPQHKAHERSVPSMSYITEFFFISLFFVLGPGNVQSEWLVTKEKNFNLGENLIETYTFLYSTVNHYYV